MKDQKKSAGCLLLEAFSIWADNLAPLAKYLAAPLTIYLLSTLAVTYISRNSTKLLAASSPEQLSTLSFSISVIILALSVVVIVSYWRFILASLGVNLACRDYLLGKTKLNYSIYKEIIRQRGFKFFLFFVVYSVITSLIGIIALFFLMCVVAAASKGKYSLIYSLAAIFSMIVYGVFMLFTIYTSQAFALEKNPKIFATIENSICASFNGFFKTVAAAFVIGVLLLIVYVLSFFTAIALCNIFSAIGISETFTLMSLISSPQAQDNIFSLTSAVIFVFQLILLPLINMILVNFYTHLLPESADIIE